MCTTHVVHARDLFTCSLPHNAPIRSPDTCTCGRCTYIHVHLYVLVQLKMASSLHMHPYNQESVRRIGNKVNMYLAMEYYVYAYVCVAVRF